MFLSMFYEGHAKKMLTALTTATDPRHAHYVHAMCMTLVVHRCTELLSHIKHVQLKAQLPLRDRASTLVVEFW